ncbi:MAG: TetR family transcriptional regulator C-terminal domain-containing protein [Rubellimicrobium sp.]|nr:TetR family transcriptional regulator C-terminal domain-containing protein [Rubellimicrobium sp.]
MTQPRGASTRNDRKANAERRRRQLLDAARRSILRHGLARTTLATVAEEAGLSQGIAVFYFKSKAGLLTETLRDLHEGYQAHWIRALDAAGPSPRDRITALIDADFAPEACGPEVLPLWFAFWGESQFSSTYAEVDAEYDVYRRAVHARIWAELLPHRSPEAVVELAEWVEMLIDGYWHRLQLSAGRQDTAHARAATWSCLVRLVPELDHPGFCGQASAEMRDLSGQARRSNPVK